MAVLVPGRSLALSNQHSAHGKPGSATFSPRSSYVFWIDIFASQVTTSDVEGQVGREGVGARLYAPTEVDALIGVFSRAHHL